MGSQAVSEPRSLRGPAHGFAWPRRPSPRIPGAMDRPLEAARRPLVGVFDVPASKSLLQRALAVAALADEACEVLPGPSADEGDDVSGLRRGLDLLGRWQTAPGGAGAPGAAGTLGTGTRSLTLDLGLGATGFRFATALATLRPAGARTLVRGRPGLLARPHHPLRRALASLGAHVRRRASGSHRVIAGGVRGGSVDVGCAGSSQHVSALMLVAPRLGGLTIRLVDAPVSVPYLGLTAQVLRAFGVDVVLDGLGGPGGSIRVGGEAPRATRFVAEPDASAGAFWWAAAALTGGRASVRGLAASSAQADLALLDVLARMGARVTANGAGDVEVSGPGGRLRAPGEVDLRASPDLLPLVAALGAGAEGTTRVVGAAHARSKESDRLATSAALVVALGGRARVEADELHVEGGALQAGLVTAAGDHRVASAGALLGLVVPGVVLRGAEAVTKSHPRLWTDLAAALAR
jgi:3-phosphoshikimate 1-carboxyvinyltransferase